MRYALLASALVASVQAHGLVRWVYGANGVKMPGLTGTVFFFSSSQDSER